MQENRIVKACNFYVSEWHLFAALLPYLKDELKKNHKIIVISQDKLEKGLRELVEKINISFENNKGLDDIIWLDESCIVNMENDYTTASIIVQGTYDFIEGVNQLLGEKLLNVYQKCTIINCYEVFESNDMLHNILNKHEFVFNTGGLHQKEDIFPDYKEEKVIAGKL